MQEAKSDAGEKKARRDAAEVSLRKEMRMVRLLAAFPLGESDPRWEAFGMNPPKRDARRRIRRDAGPAAEVIEMPVFPEIGIAEAAA